MNLYVFASVSTENIRRGIEHQLWAIPQIGARHEAARRTRAAQMRTGSAGLFYCSRPQYFTTPFIIESEPEDTTVSDVWENTWYLPFRIRTIGEIENKVPWKNAICNWPFVRDSDNRGGLLSPARAFAPIRILRSEWDDMLIDLGVDPEAYEDIF